MLCILHNLTLGLEFKGGTKKTTITGFPSYNTNTKRLRATVQEPAMTHT